MESGERTEGSGAVRGGGGGGREGRPRTKRRSSRKPEEKREFVRKKRVPQRPPQRPNDVYVTRKSSFGSQLARCSQLLEQGWTELCIHGLGMAVDRAINLALQLQETSTDPLQIYTTTSTVELVDDLEPLNDDMDFQSQTRSTSAIHITLTKTPSLPSPPPSSSPSLPSPPLSSPPHLSSPPPSSSSPSQQP